LLIAGNDAQLISKSKKQLGTKYKMKDLGPICKYLGINFLQLSDGIMIHQDVYALKVLSDANMDECKFAPVPLPLGTALADHMDSPEFDRHRYCHTVGQLLYLTQTHPDLAYAVNYVSRFMARLQESHWQAMLHILCYLQGELDLKIAYCKHSQVALAGATTAAQPLKFTAYTDANWAVCKSSRRSTGGFLFMLAGGAVTWSSKHQAIVSLSTTKAEYRSLADGAKEAVFLKRLLQELQIPTTGHIPLECSNNQVITDLQEAHLPTSVDITLQYDNISAIKLARNPVFHARSKHIELHHHYIRERILDNKLTVSYICIEDQPADIFTKALVKPAFDKHRAALGVVSVYKIDVQKL
jgi:hypothetical protein